MSPVAVVLALSLLANTSLVYVYMGARDELAVAETDRDAARAAATACSDATEDLMALSAKRAQQSQPAIAAAAARATTADKRADEVLATPATVPGNDCQSADDRVGKWLRNRK